MIFIGIFICIIAAAFFAGLETGLLSADQLNLLSLSEKRITYARAANFLLLNPEKLLSTTLIGTNLAVVTATVLLKNLFSSYGLPPQVAWIGSFFLSIILLIFSEIVPKSFFRQHADTFSVKLAPVLVGFYFLFLPIVLLLNSIVGFILFVFRQKKVNRGPKSRSDLKLLIKLVSKEAGIPLQGQRIFDDIFDFKNTIAREVMIPFHKIPVCSIDSTINVLVNLFMQTRCQFILIFKDRADNIRGYVNLVDLIKKNSDHIRDYMEHGVFYPETKRIPDLLMEMNRKKLKVVFLSDEYGGFSGMITSAEIASEIVGHIPGKKGPEDAITKLAPGHYEVEGTTDLEDIINVTGIQLTKGYYDTIGGYLCDKMGLIPEKGMIFQDKGVSYKVIDRDERHIKKVQILKQKGFEGDKK